MVYYKLHRNNYFLYVWKWISSFPYSSLFVSHGPFLAITSCTTFRPRLLSSSPRNRFHPFLRVDTSLNASTIRNSVCPYPPPLSTFPPSFFRLAFRALLPSSRPTTITTVTTTTIPLRTYAHIGKHAEETFAEKTFRDLSR